MAAAGMAAAMARKVGTPSARRLTTHFAPTRAKASLTRAFSSDIGAEAHPASPTKGMSSWGNATRIAGQLNLLLRSASPTEAELSEMRKMAAKLSEVLKDSLAEDLKIHHLECQVAELSAYSHFGSNVKYAIYGIFGFAFVMCIKDIIKLELEVEVMKDNEKWTNMRLNVLKNKIAYLEGTRALPVSEEEDGDAVPAGKGMVPAKKGMIASMISWVKGWFSSADSTA